MNDGFSLLVRVIEQVVYPELGKGKRVEKEGRGNRKCAVSSLHI
jgi:hypothetical protein